MIAKLLVSFTTWAKNRIEANKDKQCFDNESVKKERSFDLSCWKGDRQFKLPVSFKRESKLGYMDKKHGG